MNGACTNSSWIINSSFPLPWSPSSAFKSQSFSQVPQTSSSVCRKAEQLSTQARLPQDTPGRCGSTIGKLGSRWKGIKGRKWRTMPNCSHTLPTRIEQKALPCASKPGSKTKAVTKERGWGGGNARSIHEDGGCWWEGEESRILTPEPGF